MLQVRKQNKKLLSSSPSSVLPELRAKALSLSAVTESKASNDIVKRIPGTCEMNGSATAAAMLLLLMNGCKRSAESKGD